MQMKYKEDVSDVFNIRMRGEDGKMRGMVTDLYFFYHLFNKINRGFSPIIGICGSQRIGKSFVAVYISYIVHKILGKKFDPKTNTFYDPLESIKGLKEREQECLIIDEASDIVGTHEWWEKTQIAMASMINTQAFKKMIYIFVSPYVLLDVSKKFVRHFDFLIRTDMRGYFKVWIYRKRYDAIIQKDAMRRLFLDDVHAPLSLVPKSLWKKYMDYSIEMKEEIRLKRENQIIDKQKKDNISLERRLKIIGEGV